MYFILNRLVHSSCLNQNPVNAAQKVVDCERIVFSAGGREHKAMRIVDQKVNKDISAIAVLQLVCAGLQFRRNTDKVLAHECHVIEDRTQKIGVLQRIPVVGRQYATRPFDRRTVLNATQDSLECKLNQIAQKLLLATCVIRDCHRGPASLEILNAHTDIDLAELDYFEHALAKLFGYPCRISRTGYSGERGYEIFADGAVITDIWDKLAQQGVMPCSFTALDKVRIEAGLLFYGYDMTEEHTPWEIGLGFTVSTTKADYRGKAAVLAAKGAEKINNVCLEIDHTNMVDGGETLLWDGKTVGVINSPCYSHQLEKSLALAHVVPELVVGKTLSIAGEGLNTKAKIANYPIYDPTKLRTHE
ncbi:glycine cleavage system T protein [Ruegeria conchae]|uniref:Glycine cleavage system T protein n=1 Tax=Ruegeria conchae TaxID=981384 RepID=A0A497ZME9_9RHOB|nr:glycine cleavage system T protein [Ruegeria conchae]